MLTFKHSDKFISLFVVYNLDLKEKYATKKLHSNNI